MDIMLQNILLVRQKTCYLQDSHSISYILQLMVQLNLNWITV